MHSNANLRFSIQQALGVAVLSAALLPVFASAAALGKVTVLSGYGQPLRAEIALEKVLKSEEGKLVAALAPSDEFVRAKVDMLPVLQDIRFAVEKRGEGYVIVMSTDKAMADPFMTMLVEVTGGRRKQLRQYNILLDPPTTGDQPATTPEQPAAVTPPVVAGPAPQEKPAAEAAKPGSQPEAEVKPADKPVAKAAVKPEGKPVAAAKKVSVTRGNTLSAIAAANRARGVSLNQMMIALYRANPDAFVDNNINRLRAGAVLTMPGQEDAAAVTREQAQQEVTAHATDFEAYRQGLAGKVAKGAAKPARQAQSAGGKVTMKVEEKGTAELQDKLKLSAAGDKEGTGAGPGAGRAADKIAAEKAVAEANARVRELEKNVADLNKLLELKNQNLAMLEQQARAGQPAAKVPAPSAPAPAPAVPGAAGEVSAPVPATGNAPVAEVKTVPTPAMAEGTLPGMAESDLQIPPLATDHPMTDAEKAALAPVKEEATVAKRGLGDMFKLAWADPAAFAGKVKRFLAEGVKSHYFVPAMSGLGALLIALAGLLFFLRRRGSDAGDDRSVPVAQEPAADDLKIDLAAVEETPAKAASVDLSQRIDFDLNLDNNDTDVPELDQSMVISQGEAVAAVAAATAMASVAVEEDSDVAVVEEEPEQEVVPEQEAAPAAVADVAPVIEPEQAPEVVFDDEPVAEDAPIDAMPEAAAPVEEPVVAIDEGFALDLPPEASPDAAEDENAALMEELGNKLDLAEAYLNIGDKEGARELLQEVSGESVAGLQDRIQALEKRL